MNKTTIVGTALAGFAGVVLIVGVLLLMFGGKYSDLRSPESLENLALTGSAEEQEKAALDLGRFVPPDPNAKKAKDALRKILRESTVPQVRAAAIQGLGALKDWESLDKLIDGLDDENAYVRARSIVAVSEVMGTRYNKYNPDDPEEERKKAVEPIRELGLHWKAFKEKEQKAKGKG